MEKEKKEIGMEKLIELLNEYEGQDTWSYDEEMGMPYYGWGDDCDYDAYLISKKYGFIKWLVENDKTDDYKIRKAREEIGSVIDYFYKIPGAAEKSLLMLLSISDTPIEDLISYLK